MLLKLNKMDKSYAGERNVPISKALRPILERALEEMKENPMGLLCKNYEGVTSHKRFQSPSAAYREERALKTIEG